MLNTGKYPCKNLNCQFFLLYYYIVLRVVERCASKKFFHSYCRPYIARAELQITFELSTYLILLSRKSTVEFRRPAIEQIRSRSAPYRLSGPCSRVRETGNPSNLSDRTSGGKLSSIPFVLRRTLHKRGAREVFPV